MDRLLQEHPPPIAGVVNVDQQLQFPVSLGLLSSEGAMKVTKHLRQPHDETSAVEPRSCSILVTELEVLSTAEFMHREHMLVS